MVASPPGYKMIGDFLHCSGCLRLRHSGFIAFIDGFSAEVSPPMDLDWRRSV